MSDYTPTQMLDALQARGWPPVAIERVAQLPFGSIAKWQAGEITPEELAFLRMIHVFPWTLTFLDTGHAGKALQEGLEKAFVEAQVAVLEALADRMTVSALGDQVTVVRVRNIIYKLRDSLG